MGEKTGIRVIPTEYVGVTFRGRTEARWAVFFDTLGVPWEYEKEAFTELGVSYLPDFWLPDQDCWWEVKPERALAEDEGAKLRLVVRATGKRLYLAKGAPSVMDESCRTCQAVSIMNDGAYVYMPCGGPAHEEEEGDDGICGWDNYQLWCECSKCHQVGLTFGGRSERLCTCFSRNEKLYGAHTDRLHRAYSAARAYRFWNPPTDTYIGPGGMVMREADPTRLLGPARSGSVRVDSKP